MKEKILILFILFSSCCIGQEVFNSHKDVYIKDNLFYKKRNDSLFSGNIEIKTIKGTIISKEEYESGFLKKKSEYFNKSEKGKVYRETYYGNTKNNFKKLKEVKYHTTGKLYSINYFDDNENKNLEEYYDENGKIVYSCEYKNGKKNGKEFCVTKKCENKIDYYVDGKKNK